MKVSKFLLGFLIVMLLLPLFHEPVFAVYIFSDGFETNDYTAWTGTTLLGGAKIATDSTQKNTGSYSSKSNWSASGDAAFAEKSLTDINKLYLREYAYIDLRPVGTYKRFGLCKLRDNTATMDLLELLIYQKTAGTYVWYITYRAGGSATSVEDTDLPIVNDTWTCIEMMADLSTSDGDLDGSYEIWINGTSIWSVTGKDTDSTTVDTIRCGLTSNTDPNANTMWVDDAVADSSYIGLIAGGPTAYTVDLTQSVTAGFAVLLHTTFQSTLALSSTVGLSIVNKAAFTVITAFGATAGFLVDLITGHVGISYLVNLALNPTTTFLSLLKTNLKVVLDMSATTSLTNLLSSMFQVVTSFEPSFSFILALVTGTRGAIAWIVELTFNPTTTLLTLLKSNFQVATTLQTGIGFLVNLFQSSLYNNYFVNLIFTLTPGFSIPEWITATTADFALALAALAFIVAMTGIGLFALRRRD